VDNSKVWRLGRFLCRAFSAQVHSWATNLGLRPRLVYGALSALYDDYGSWEIMVARFATVMRVGKSRSRENVGLGEVWRQRFATVMRVGKSQSHENVGLGKVWRRTNRGGSGGVRGGSEIQRDDYPASSGALRIALGRFQRVPSARQGFACPAPGALPRLR